MHFKEQTLQNLMYVCSTLKFNVCCTLASCIWDYPNHHLKRDPIYVTCMYVHTARVHTYIHVCLHQRHRKLFSIGGHCTLSGHNFYGENYILMEGHQKLGGTSPPCPLVPTPIYGLHLTLVLSIA